MHGGGVGSGDAGPAASVYQAAARRLDWVGVFPEVLEKTELGWTTSGTEEFVLDLIDGALRTWRIDPDRVYLAGHSMGGYGSWTLGAHHADRIAAIAPSAGAPTPILDRSDKVVDLVEGVIPNLRNVFVAQYQSTDDPQVPPGPAQLAVRRLGEAAAKWGGFAHHYWEVDGQGHGLPPGGAIAHLERLADKVRDPVPARIVWQPDLTWKRQLYWLYWEAPVRHALLVADLDRAANAVRIRCDKPTDGLWVLLDERVADLGKEITVAVNDREVFKGKAVQALRVLLATGIHPDPALQFEARVPAR
jgi:pimeloyl-ACP methyl ester carboxylesterase